MKTIKSKSPFFISCIVSIALMSLFAQETSLADEKEKKNVLVVNSYHPGYEWSDDIVKGIQSVLGDNNFNIFIEYLDSKRYSDDTYFKSVEELIRYKYGDAKIDAIIVSDHHAFNLMLGMRKTFQTDVPLIFCGIDFVDPEDVADYKPIYGINEGDSGIRSTLDLILSMHPGIHKIFFVADQTTSAKVMLKYVRDYEPSYKDIVTFDYLINMSTSELKAALKNVTQNSVVMWLHFIKDKNGEVFSLAESQTFVANNTSVPVYVCYGFRAGTGIVGGSIIRGFTQGEKAAQIVLELLIKNKSPSPIFLQSPFIDMFDYKVMKRFDIGINDIPENSVIYNRSFSVFENYRWQIVGILIFIGFQTLLISILIINLKKRKTGEKSLLESEERFRATFEQAAVGIAHVSTEGRFFRINRKFCEILGYSIEEMLERTFQAITHPDDLDADVAEVQRLLDGEKTTYSMEKRYIRKDKHNVWVNLTVSLVRDKADAPAWFVAVVRDIGERKKAEIALRDSEQKFRDLIDQSPSVFELYDRDGVLVQVNPAFEKLWNLSGDDVVGKFNVFESDQVKEKGLVPYFRRAFEGESLTPPVMEFDASLEEVGNREKSRKRWLNGFLYPVKDINGQVTHVVMMHEDITKQKQAEIETEGIRNYTDHLIQTANVMIVNLDNQGQIMHFNPAAEKITGYILADIKGKNWFELIAPPDRYPEVHEEFDRIMKGGLPKNFENPILTKAGEERYISWANSEIKQENKITGITSFGIDITERKLAEEALKESEEKFRHLVEQSPFAIQIFNTNGYLDQVNEAFMKLWGVTEESLPELLGKYNVLEDEEARRLGISKAIKRAFKGDFVMLPLIEYDAASTFTDIGMSKEGGNKRWILPRLYPLKNAQGDVVKVVDMEEDITERKYAEEKYRVLVEQAQDGITIIRDGKIIFVNPYLAKLQGYAESEIIGTPITDYIFPDEIEKVREIYQLRMAGKPAPMVYESALRSKDGLRLEVEFNAAVIIYEGKPADLVIVRDISERKQVERELKQYRGRLQSLAAELTLTEEKERRRIAADLHDQIGQILASTRFQLAAMQKTIVDPSLSEKLSKVSGNLRQAVDDTRHIISDLSSPLLDELGFEAAISEWLEENVQNRFDIKTSLSSNTKQIDLHENVGIMLYRSVRELLTNVIKHARATKVDVIIDAQDETLNLTVRDDGIGFNYDPKQYSVKGAKSLGLFSIRERMSDLGGEMIVKSSKSKGTEVTLIASLDKK